MSKERANFVPEVVDAHGPGADFWLGPDDNNYRQLDEDEVRARTDVRRRFLENQRKVIEARIERDRNR